MIDQPERNLVTRRRVLLVGGSVAATQVARPRAAAAQSTSGLVLSQGGTVDDPAITRIVHFETIRPANGPFTWEVGGAWFNGTYDPVSYFGYNIQAGGQPVLAGEPAASFNIEGDYNDGGQRLVEMYWSYHSADNQTVIRPIFFNFDRATNRINNATIRGEPLYFRTGSDDQILGEVNRFRTLFNAVDSGTFVLQANALSRQPVELRLSASFQSLLTVRVTPDSSNRALHCQTILGNNLVLTLNDVNPGARAGSRQLTASFFVNEAQAALTVRSPSVNYNSMKTAVLGKKSGQTGAILELQDEATRPLSRVNANGYVTTLRNTPPTDAELAVGEGALWWDPTPGTGGLRYKGKDSGGGILSGPVPPPIG